MKYGFIAARIVLGAIFLIFGLNGFLGFLENPPLPADAGQFLGIMAASGYLYAVKTFEVLGGLLLLVNRRVPLGLVFLGPVIVNILLFHAFLAPGGIGLGLVVTVAWLAVFWQQRAAFAGIVPELSRP